MRRTGYVSIWVGTESTKEGLDAIPRAAAPESVVDAPVLLSVALVALASVCAAPACSSGRSAPPRADPFPHVPLQGRLHDIDIVEDDQGQAWLTKGTSLCRLRGQTLDCVAVPAKLDPDARLQLLQPAPGAAPVVCVPDSARGTGAFAPAKYLRAFTWEPVARSAEACQGGISWSDGAIWTLDGSTFVERAGDAATAVPGQPDGSDHKLDAGGVWWRGDGVYAAALSRQSILDGGRRVSPTGLPVSLLCRAGERYFLYDRLGDLENGSAGREGRDRTIDGTFDGRDHGRKLLVVDGLSAQVLAQHPAYETSKEPVCRALHQGWVNFDDRRVKGVLCAATTCKNVDFPTEPGDGLLYGDVGLIDAGLVVVERLSPGDELRVSSADAEGIRAVRRYHDVDSRFRGGSYFRLRSIGAGALVVSDAAIAVLDQGGSPLQLAVHWLGDGAVAP